MRRAEFINKSAAATFPSSDLSRRSAASNCVAAIVGSGIFLIGAAIGHAYQIALTHNMAPGNAGITFYSDIVLPVIGVVLLGLQWKSGRCGA